MLAIGEALQAFYSTTLTDCWNGTGVSVTAVNGRTGIVAFINFDTGWEWLRHLVHAWNHTGIQDRLHIIAVIFRNSTPLSAALVTNKKSNDTDLELKNFDFNTATHFNVVTDELDGTGSYYNRNAIVYENGIINDAQFPGASGGIYWTYLTTNDNKISDKWHSNCMSATLPNNDNPISFRHLAKHAAFVQLSGAPGAGLFQLTLSNIAAGGKPLSGDTVITYQGAPNAYTRDFSGPRVKSVSPSEGTTETGLMSLPPLVIAFTDAVTGAATAANYALSGAIGTLAVASVEYADALSFDTTNHTREDFDSKILDNAEFYLKQRLIQLCHNAAILYAEPEKDSVMKALGTAIVHFSKPMDPTKIHNVPGNFSTSIAGLAVSTVSYANKDQYENKATLTLSGPLAEGSFTIGASNLTDTAGTAMVGSTTVPYLANVTGPVLTAGSFPTPAYCKDTNGLVTLSISASDATSGVESYQITGDVTATVAGSGWDGSNLSVSFNLSGADGSKNVKLTVTDKAGNSADTGNRTIVLDRAAPTALSFPTPTYCTDANGLVTLTISASDATSGVDSYQITGDVTATVAGSGWNGSNLSVSFNLSGADGSKKVKLTVTDKAGNLADTGDKTIILDRAAPINLSFPTPASCADANGLVALSISASDATSGVDSYQITGDVTATVAGSGWNGSSLSVSFNLSGADGNKNVKLTVTDKAGNSADTGDKTIALQRPQPALPENIMFVLDYSGTMDTVVPFDGTAKPKVEWVKDAVINFTSYLLGSVTSSDYNIGIVLYSTGICLALGLTPKSAITVNLINTALSQMPPRDCTAMGKGLAWALDSLSYQTPPAGYNGLRAIVHLADGQQNVAPDVEALISDPNHPELGKLTIDTNIPNSGCPANMGLIEVKGNAIPIHTLGIGGNSQWFQIMTQISSITGGTHLEDGQIWPLVDHFFINTIPSLFPYASPQIVRNEQEVMQPGRENRFNFPLNATVRKLVVCCAWAGTTGLACALKKGTHAVAFDTIVEKQGLFIGTVSFPHYEMHLPRSPIAYLKEGRIGSDDPRFAAVTYSQPIFEINGARLHGHELPERMRIAIDPAGDWAAFVSKKASDPTPAADYPFLLAVIVDEKELKYRIDPFLKVLWTGDPMPFGAALAQGQSPYSGVPDATVSVSRPTTSLGNILAAQPGLIATVPPGHFPEGGEIQDTRRRLELLLQNKEVASLMGKWQTKSISLGPRSRSRRKSLTKGGGSLAATYADTRLPGTYRIKMVVSAKDGKNGVYERVQYGNVLVRVRPDFSSSTLEGKVDGRKVQIVFTPRDRFGNCLGAGYGALFSIKFQDLKIVNVVDDLSGTYRLEGNLPAGPYFTQGDFKNIKQKLFEALVEQYMRQ